MDNVRFTPEMYIDYYTSLEKISIEDIGVSPVVVVSWARGVIQSMAESTGAAPSPYWFYKNRNLFFRGEVRGQTVSFAQVPVGAPGTVLVMEEMIACGARVFLALGWAGSLQPDAPIGTFLIPTSCIREEGTSFHYVEKDESITPDEGLVRQLQSVAETAGEHVISGPQWTTDAPYRELQSKIDAYREQGVLGVDMETSAMYALGRFRGVKVCNLLVISDELWQEWHPAFRSSKLKKATHRAWNVILECVGTDLLLG